MIRDLKNENSRCLSSLEENILHTEIFFLFHNFTFTYSIKYKSFDSSYSKPFCYRLCGPDISTLYLGLWYNRKSDI